MYNVSNMTIQSKNQLVSSTLSHLNQLFSMFTNDLFSLFQNAHFPTGAWTSFGSDPSYLANIHSTQMTFQKSMNTLYMTQYVCTYVHYDTNANTEQLFTKRTLVLTPSPFTAQLTMCAGSVGKFRSTSSITAGHFGL
jgi:hypothetical protein